MVNRVLNILLLEKMLKKLTFKLLLPKMSAYRRDYDKTKIMSFLVKDEKCWKNIMKFGKKATTLSIKNLTVNLDTMKSI